MDSISKEHKKSGRVSKREKSQLPTKVYRCRRLWKCTQCSKTFGKKRTLVEHLRVHNEEGQVHSKRLPYSCSVCKQSFPNYASCNNHLKYCKTKIQVGKLHVCEICNKGFAAKYGLKIHLRSHSDQKPYKCRSCDKKFKHRGHLTAHEITHVLATEKQPCRVCCKVECSCRQDFSKGTPVVDKALNGCEVEAVVKQELVENGELDIPVSDTLIQDMIEIEGFDMNITCNGSIVNNSMHSGKENILQGYSKLRRRRRIWKCSYCPKEFNRKQSLTEHVRIHTNERPYECQLCLKTFKLRHQWKSHQRVHADKRPWSCPNCRKCFASFWYCKTHVTYCTNDEEEDGAVELPHICDTCGKGFKIKYSLKIHQRTHSDEKPYECPICSKSFKYHGHLTAHHRQAHSTNAQQWICPVCSKFLSTEATLKRHLKTHAEGEVSERSSEKGHACGVCGKEFTTKKSLNRHSASHDSDGTLLKKKPKKLHLCEICGKGFGCTSTLYRHSETHGAQKDWLCDVCGKTFVSKSSLKQHDFSHRPRALLFKCKFCSKGFPVSARLKLHMRIHTGEKPYSCTICRKKFAYRGSLVTHNRVHTQEKPFQCSVCKKTFSQRCSLDCHLVTHTGELPFSCTICGKKFSQRTALKQHYRVHTKETFTCKLCGERFFDRPTFKKHENSHSVEDRDFTG